MKKLIPIFALIFCLLSCKSEDKKTPTNPQTIPLSERPIPTLPNANNLAVSVVGGAHYLCPNKCNGGASSVKGTTCPVCKTTLAHNQGFHNTPNKTTSTPISTPVASTATGPNASGQYHYTCAIGCAGGGDTAGKCNSCGGDLAHNAAFHN